MVANNAFAFRADSSRPGVVHISQTTVTGNTKTWEGFSVSYGDNYIAGDGDGAPTAILTVGKK